MAKTKLVTRDPQHIVNMIDNEGWPDALDFLVKNDFGDEKLNHLIAQASEEFNELKTLEADIQNRAVELGVDWYIA